MYSLELSVNGQIHRVEVGADTTLLELLRDKLGITSPKVGCNTGDCGACSVLLDGHLVNSCITNALTAQGRSVVTVEGLGRPGALHPLQKTFHDFYAAQCGFCTPGMIMAAKALLDKNPDPTRQEVKVALSGNLCRCTGYVKIIDAVMAAAEEMKSADVEKRR
jgi:aerobic-type carbon monoxide dehydrogenase small subunit (CoxS/CutS family)